jgi:bifunctional UDP-N-acetylglucosamine pyrophosphorylase/glucosamine-1-phosphate N-acetyltransferase/UDP-N-acetylglucosamine pyrophosphorylase
VESELVDEPGVEFALQAEQLGTGHAVMMCRGQLADHRGPVFIVAGDSPLLQSSSVKRLLENFAALGASCVLGTVEKANPTGYGRIVRDGQGNFTGIIEEKDATPEQRAIREVNVSTYVFDSHDLLWALDQVTDANVQREYYITDCPAILMAADKKVTAEKVLQPCESLSINNMDELALVEEEMKRLGMARE